MQPGVPGGEMTIGELAARFGLATHVLRHWEAVGLLAPATRVSGHRRYRREHVARVATILFGKEAGFSLEELGEVLDAPDSAARRALLERHHAALERRIAQIRVAQELVEHVLGCPTGDFTRCPDFQQMAETAAVRVPLHAAGASPARARRSADGGGVDDDRGRQAAAEYSHAATEAGARWRTPDPHRAGGRWGAPGGRRPTGEADGQRGLLEGGAISERQYRGLLHAREHGTIARREYVQLTGVSERTAVYDLAALVRRGLLEPTGGRGRRTAYRVRDGTH